MPTARLTPSFIGQLITAITFYLSTNHHDDTDRTDSDHDDTTVCLDAIARLAAALTDDTARDALDATLRLQTTDADHIDDDDTPFALGLLPTTAYHLILDAYQTN